METSKSKYVYLIRQGYTNKYKIGVSKNLEFRRKGLQTANPLNLSIVAYFFSDYPYKIETSLHRQWDRFRETGEWFELEQEHIDSFIAICDSIEKNINFLKQEGNPFI